MAVKEMDAPMLDIIVPHYNEPWEDGKKLFDMLALQRGINFQDIRVTVIQDGPDGALDWHTLLSPYPFDSRIKTIQHGGISMARNVGIHISRAEWILFIDFDDMLASVNALRRYMENMSDDYDMIYGHVTGEQENGSHYTLELYADNDTFIHGKMFRRKFLIDGNLWFENGVDFSEDTVFCHVMRMELNPARQKEIPERLFFHTWREGSTCRKYENNFSNAVGIFRGRQALVREYRDRGRTKNFIGTVVKTVFDYFYALQYHDYPNKPYFEQDFWYFWQQYRDEFEFADRDLFAFEKEQAHCEAAHKGFLTAESMTIWDWIAKMERKYGTPVDDMPDRNTLYPRVAVYHVTRNLYENMIASAKSMVMHSSVEKIYFLIEDDCVPDPNLPEFIECINVSDQQYILPSSPNYQCQWTWMVMLRAAFPKIFPQHDVILSIDADAVVEHNIDDIWNTDLSDAYYAAVRESQSSEERGRLWTNMGVCLLNLKKLREDGMDDRILQELNTVRHTYTEQEVFNLFCEGHIAELPSDYNACAFTALPKADRIVHFAGTYNASHALIEKYKPYEWEDILDGRNAPRRAKGGAKRGRRK